MCGIAGIVNIERDLPPTLQQVTAMISMLRHRGPDASGVYLDPAVALGHLRLSIIGIDGGTQPICNETGTLWIIYNGEAFNYIELKEDLIKRGHRFTTETDTEVVLHLYEEYGNRCLEKINGQFSFAIWNSIDKELFLARDRVGIRPLYYTWAGGRLVFASEIKAILAVTGTRELDIEALSQVFHFWTTLTGKTIFKGIEELPPGHSLLVKRGRAEPVRYWAIPFHSHEDNGTMSFDDAAEGLRELLKDAVRLRLRADVPVGAYLSGGLDSSIISMLISKNFNNRLKTISMGFRESHFDESSFQEELINFLGTDHTRILIDNEQVRKYLPETIWHCEKPLLRTSPVPLFLLSRLVHSEGLKVVLSGEGADEILGGYNIFKEAKIRSFWGRDTRSKLRPLLLEKLYPYIFKNPSRGRQFLHGFFAVNEGESEHPFFSHKIRWENSKRNLAFLSDESIAQLSRYDAMDELEAGLPDNFKSRDVVSRAQVLEMEIFLSNYLLSSQGDRVAMAHSVELRHPFLDYRVIDFAFRLPSKWKLKGLNEKYILKHAFKNLLPERITRRAKQPYRAPIRELFSPGAPADYVNELMTEGSLKKCGYFNAKKVSILYDKYMKSDNFSNEFQNMALMGVLSTQMLHNQFIETFDSRTVVQVNPDKVVHAVAKKTEESGFFESAWSALS